MLQIYNEHSYIIVSCSNIYLYNNQIFMFYDIDLSVILPYLSWLVALILFYLLLGKDNKQ